MGLRKLNLIFTALAGLLVFQIVMSGWESWSIKKAEH